MGPEPRRRAGAPGLHSAHSDLPRRLRLLVCVPAVTTRGPGSPFPPSAVLPRAGAAPSSRGLTSLAMYFRSRHFVRRSRLEAHVNPT
ncbi:hypothetical protein NDU88_003907 [Pleurodeles waltl]|uniref:Uncharacterized protein n=1 Tax=Pleurodeles waltl TaxID=8319 RepID=A0AAV7UDZ3_PLEWA|nr:hypothetical protein NDU88_003907 [Pleurodeles waltl]